MTAATDIANRALYHIGDEKIASLTENSRRARVVNEFYEDTRDSLIQGYNWKFAIKRASLAALTGAPVSGYSVQYQLPSDYLAMVQVSEYWAPPSMNDYRTFDDKLWDVEDGKILTNLSAPLKIRYVRRVEDPNAWTPLFREALAYALAVKLFRPLAAKGVAAELLREFVDTLERAAMRNEIEAPPDAIADDSWVLGRVL